jgi:CelD/BcsL family acetyltransferase involved in cellulose biosynthesis
MTVTVALEIEAHRGPEALEVPEWRELYACDHYRSVFSTPEWNRVWWEEFQADKELLVLVMRRAGAPIGVIPLYVKTDGEKKILRFNGGIDLTDYLGPICRSEDRYEVAEALVAWLQEERDLWTEFDAHNMPVPFGFAEFLVERADASGLDFVLEQEETSAILELPESWDDYLAALDSKERHELKRKQRRLGREHPDARFRTSTDETLETDLQTFIDMHRGADGHKGHFMRPEIATFFERMAEAFMPLGWLRLDFLEVGDRAIAATFGFELDGTLYLYNSAFDFEAKRLSPGLLLVADLIEKSIDRGLKVFDFLRGPERYKYQLGAQAVPLNNVRLLRSESP